MEKESTGYLAKTKHSMRRESKANKNEVLIYYDISTCRNSIIRRDTMWHKISKCRIEIQLWTHRIHIYPYTVSKLGYVFSTAIAPGHRCLQCWLNIHYIGPVPYIKITLMGNNMRKWNYILKKKYSVVQELTDMLSGARCILEKWFRYNGTRLWLNWPLQVSNIYVYI